VQRSRDQLLIAAGTILICVFLLGLAESLTWIGKPFPGFLVLENKVVPSAGLTRWPATAGGAIYQHEITAVDGRSILNVGEIHARVAEAPPGTPISYRFDRDGHSFEQIIETRRFDRVDYTLLFGSLLINGLALGGTALMIRYLRGRDRLAVGSFPILLITGIWSITAVDLYGPYRLFRLHALCETLLFAGVLHMALVFPHPSRLVQQRPWVVWALYVLAGFLALANQVGLYDPALYRPTHLLAVSAFGTSLVVLIAAQFRWYLRPPSFEARQRVKVHALGTAATLSGPLVLSLGSALTSGETPQNVMTFTGIFYPLSIGYAVLRHDLLEVDIFVRRTLSYAILTVLATITYVGLIQSFELVFNSTPTTGQGLLGVFFTVLLVILLLPLRDRMQSAIDRVFFRTAYDFRRVVEMASAHLASVADLRVISDELSRAIKGTLHPDSFAMYVRHAPDSPFSPFPPEPGLSDLSTDTLSRLSDHIDPVDEPGGSLSVPFRADGELVAVLVLGRPRSGRMYGADDRRLLQTLANQGAVAIENALALEQLRELNRDLEEKVEERTQELREAHAQLVHREKMASLGQFVAGIAHEINNPLNFIQGNLHCLRQYMNVLRETLQSVEQAAGETNSEISARIERIRADNELDEILKDVESAFDGCAEGIDRSTSLVGDLRTFSRLDQPERVLEDIEATIDSTLNLLRGKLTAIRVVKDFGGIPAAECLAGQLNQVIVNLVANAADAVGDEGTIQIRTKRLGDDHVVIEVEDDGNGIDPEHLDRIFDPFFTTKEVGKGTGLGLSMSYEIITRHGGTISVRSQPGEGTCFHIELPLKSSA
jgi:signal transduction histidine kinase